MKYERHIRWGIDHTETVITKTGSIMGPGIGPILHELP